jgi:hypothetical protein
VKRYQPITIASIRKGGLATNGDLRICVEYICAPCSLSFGSKEGIFRCLEHSDERNDDESNNADEDTQVVVKETEQHPSWKKRNDSQVAAKGVRELIKSWESFGMMWP